MRRVDVLVIGSVHVLAPEPGRLVVHLAGDGFRETRTGRSARRPWRGLFVPARASHLPTTLSVPADLASRAVALRLR